MILDVDPDSRVPIYEQIVAQITFAIASGSLAVGTMIPSVRDLAQQLLVHPNTVAKAFRKLEGQGVVVARPGLGMEVTADAPAACRALRQEIVRVRVRDVLREATSSALSPAEIRNLVDEELARVNGRKTPREK